MSRRFKNYGDNISNPPHHSITKKSNLPANQASQRSKGPKIRRLITYYLSTYRSIIKYLPFIIVIFAISIASPEFRTLALYPAIAYVLIKGVDMVINQRHRKK